MRRDGTAPGANRKLLWALAAVVLVAVAAGVALLFGGPRDDGAPVANMPAPSAAPAAGGAMVDQFTILEPAGDFALVAPLQPDGKAADMAVYRGKALLVNFWATWCGPCIQELPALGKLQAMLGGADFAVVTIALDEPDPAKVAPFLAAHGAAGLPALVDGDRSINKVMAVSALPTSLLVDKAGKVRAVLTGDAHWNCGAALEAVKAFIGDGTVSMDKLDRCQ